MIVKDLAKRASAVRNPFGRAHDRLVARHLAGIGAIGAAPVCYRQSRIVILCKIAALACVLYGVFLAHTFAGGWLEKGFAFFRLHQIYNFTFPKRAFFDRAALAGMGIFAAYHGAGLLYRQFLGLFSVLAVDVKGGAVAYVRSAVIFTHTFIYRAGDLDTVALGQNIFGRIFGVGTVEICLRTGGILRIPALSRPRRAVKDILAAKSWRSPGGAADGAGAAPILPAAIVRDSTDDAVAY